MFVPSDCRVQLPYGAVWGSDSLLSCNGGVSLPCLLHPQMETDKGRGKTTEENKRRSPTRKKSDVAEQADQTSNQATCQTASQTAIEVDSRSARQSARQPVKQPASPSDGRIAVLPCTVHVWMMMVVPVLIKVRKQTPSGKFKRQRAAKYGWVGSEGRRRALNSPPTRKL